ncbi:MAG: putative small integral membrane protein [Gammaproteobacteria bacterium]|jgi:predicted small integral membrane protein
MNRYIKIALVTFASLFCLFYAIHNIANLGPAELVVGAMTGMEGHEVFPSTFAFPVKSPVLVKTILWIIILLELAAGLLAGKGAIDMLGKRNGSSDEFNGAKTYALAGTGLAVIIWFGIFGAFGGALFQMWQVEAGANMLRDASLYGLQHGMLWLIIRADDS